MQDKIITASRFLFVVIGKNTLECVELLNWPFRSFAGAHFEIEMINDRDTVKCCRSDKSEAYISHHGNASN